MTLREALERLAEADRIVLDVGDDYHAWMAQEIVDGVGGWRGPGSNYYDQQVQMGHCLFDAEEEKLLPGVAVRLNNHADRVQCISRKPGIWSPPLFIIPDRISAWDVIVDRAEKEFHRHVEFDEGVWAVNLPGLREELEILVCQVLGTRQPGSVVTLVFDHFGFFETIGRFNLRRRWRGLAFFS